MSYNQPNNLRDFMERNRQREQQRMKAGMWDAYRRKQKGGGGYSPVGGCLLGRALAFLLLLPFKIILLPIKFLAALLAVLLKTAAYIVVIVLLVIVVAAIVLLLHPF